MKIILADCDKTIGTEIAVVAETPTMTFSIAEVPGALPMLKKTRLRLS